MRKSRQKVLDSYIEAIKDLKRIIELNNPIKQSDFIKKHAISSNFLQVLTEIGAIESIIYERKSGSLYVWKYRQADNEADSFLAMRVADMIQSIRASKVPKIDKIASIALEPLSKNQFYQKIGFLTIEIEKERRILQKIKEEIIEKETYIDSMQFELQKLLQSN